MRAVFALVLVACTGTDSDSDPDTSDMDTSDMDTSDMDTSMGTDADTEDPTEVLATFNSSSSGFSNNTVAVALGFGNPSTEAGCSGGAGLVYVGDDAQIDDSGEGTYRYDGSEDTDFAAGVACLTNGENDDLQIVLVSDGSLGFSRNTEQGLGIGSPDLQGATITAFEIEVTDITAQNVGSLIYSVESTTRILGIPAGD